MNTSLEVQQDGRIFLIPNCPVEPKKWEQGDSLSYNEAAWQFYKEALASAERYLVSNQEVARELLFLKHCIFPKEIALKEVAGIYPINPSGESYIIFHFRSGTLPESKEKQKRLLIEMMQEDEKYGMYDIEEALLTFDIAKTYKAAAEFVRWYITTQSK